MLCFKDTTWWSFNTYYAMGYLLLMVLSVFLEGLRYLVLRTIIQLSIIQLSMYNLPAM